MPAIATLIILFGCVTSATTALTFMEVRRLRLKELFAVQRNLGEMKVLWRRCQPEDARKERT